MRTLKLFSFFERNILPNAICFFIIISSAGFSPVFANVTDGGEIGYNQTICQGEVPALLVNVVLPSGGTGEIEYMWMQRTSPTGDWVEIPGSNSEDYQPGALIQTTYFQRCARRAGFVNYTGETPIVVITVKPLPLSQIDNPPSQIEQNIPIDFSAVFAGIGASYEWDFGPGAIPSSAFAQNVPGVVFSGTDTQNITLTVTSQDGCETETTYSFAILPVELSEFKGELKDGRIHLYWTTLSEYNNEGFEVLKGSSETNLSKIAFIRGNEEGITFEETKYAYQDDLPNPGWNYYQLRQIDRDGRFSFSNIIVIERKVELHIDCFPNPFSESFTIREISESKNFANRYLEVIQMSTGRQVLQKDLIEVESNLSFSLSSYENGSYLVRLISGSTVEAQEVIQKIN